MSLQKLLNYLNNIKVNLIPIKYVDERILDYVININKPNCITQVIRHDLIINHLQVKIAAYNTFRAFEMKLNRAKKLNIEFILNLTCKSQIKEAINIVTPKKGGYAYIIVVCTSEENQYKLVNDLVNLFSEYIVEHVEESLEEIFETLKKVYGLKNINCASTDKKKCILLAVLTKISIFPYSK